MKLKLLLVVTLLLLVCSVANASFPDEIRFELWCTMDWATAEDCVWADHYYNQELVTTGHPRSADLGDLPAGHHIVSVTIHALVQTGCDSDGANARIFTNASGWMQSANKLGRTNGNLEWVMHTFYPPAGDTWDQDDLDEMHIGFLSCTWDYDEYIDLYDQYISVVSAS